MKLLIFGEHGQVARALRELTATDQVTFCGRERLDLSSPVADVAAVIAAERPAAVINASAYTAVDRAEIETQACMRLNRDAPLAMAKACAAAGVPFVHFSTDYVFDGAKGAPYVESDPRNPINVYGRSKAQGESALERLAGFDRWAVIRTGWVYSAGGSNFVRTMLRLAGGRDEVAVVADQRGCPTPASDCARAALALAAGLLDGDPAFAGLFHACGPEAMSWADFAEAIFAAGETRLGKTMVVRRITTADYPTAAARPLDTRLDCTRLRSVSTWRPRAFNSAIADCVARMDLE